MGMSRNCFDDIWYAIRLWFCNFIAKINKYRLRSFYPGNHLKANEMII